jgi:hypothetical protein
MLGYLEKAAGICRGRGAYAPNADRKAAPSTKDSIAKGGVCPRPLIALCNHKEERW